MNARPLQSILNLFQSKGNRRAVSRRGRTTRLSVESLEHRTLMAANIFESPVEILDVNNDGVVSPLDALLVINQLPEDGGAYELAPSELQLDTSGNGLLSEVDALLIISRLDPAFHEPRAALALAAPASAQGATQISGKGVVLGFGAECGGLNLSAPDGLTLELTEGNLVGCWFTTEVTQFKGNPSGTFDESGGTVQERGRETFVGSYYDNNGVLLGTGEFSTTYKFSGKFDANFDEIHGRCEHPLVNDTGIGVFEDYTGRVDFKDIDPPSGDLEYRGHFRLPNGG